MKNSTLFWLSLTLGSFVIIANAFFIVDKRERAVMFQLGEIRGTDYAPGLHIKIPFVQSVRKFDARMLTLDNQTETFLTKERKNVEVDFFVKWRIADTTAYYRATGGQEQVAADRLGATVNRGLRDQFGLLTIREAVSGERDLVVPKLDQDAADAVKEPGAAATPNAPIKPGNLRDEIAQELARSAGGNVEELGVEILDVRIKSINLPKEVSGSVYDRMRAERTRTASDLRAKGAEEAEKIRAEADREAAVTLATAYRDSEKLRGEGDAKAAELYARAYGQDAEFYSFYRSLGVYRDAFSGKQDVLVLEPKGDFFKYFKNGSGKK